MATHSWCSGLYVCHKVAISQLEIPAVFFTTSTILVAVQLSSNGDAPNMPLIMFGRSQMFRRTGQTSTEVRPNFGRIFLVYDEWRSSQNLPKWNVAVVYLHRVSKKLCKLIFCQNFAKFRPIIKIFGVKIAERTSFSEVYSFSTSPNLCQRTTVWNADVQNCYIML